MKLHIDINIIVFIVYKLRISRIMITIIITLFLKPIADTILPHTHRNPYYCSHFVAEQTEALSIDDYSIII